MGQGVFPPLNRRFPRDYRVCQAGTLDPLGRLAPCTGGCGGRSQSLEAEFREAEFRLEQTFNVTNKLFGSVQLGHCPFDALDLANGPRLSLLRSRPG